MPGFLAKAIFGTSTDAAKDPWQPIIAAAIDKAVDGSDPRLRALRGYRRKLREPVTRAAHFAHEFGEGLPAPIEVSRDAFSVVPQLRAFFSSANRMEEVFSTSVEVQEFLSTPANRGQDFLHAALVMDLSERTVLAPALRGEQVQQEVERTQVSFDEHRVLLPAPTEAGLRRQVKERAFTTLVECALERMVARRERKGELQQQRALLRAKSHAVRATRSGLNTFSAPTQQPVDSSALQRALEQTEKELRVSAASGDLLERNLEDLCATLAHPEEFLSLQLESRRLTGMNYALAPGDVEPADTVEFARIVLKGKTRVCGILARHPVREIKAAGFYSDKMRRALGVQR